jgi:hypothetical protein
MNIARDSDQLSFFNVYFLTSYEHKHTSPSLTFFIGIRIAILWYFLVLVEFPASAFWVQVLMYMSVILMVFYLSTGLAGCSMNPGINHGARKLTRIPRIIKKKNLKGVANFT